MNGPLAAGEERKAVGRQRLQRWLLDLDEMRPDLAPRGPVNAESGNRPIPVPQERILRVEAVEAPALQRVGFDIAATPLLLPILLRGARLRGMSLGLLKFSGGSVDDYAICRSS